MLDMKKEFFYTLSSPYPILFIAHSNKFTIWRSLLNALQVNCQAAPGRIIYQLFPFLLVVQLPWLLMKKSSGTQAVGSFFYVTNNKQQQVYPFVYNLFTHTFIITIIAFLMGYKSNKIY